MTFTQNACDAVTCSNHAVAAPAVHESLNVQATGKKSAGKVKNADGLVPAAKGLVLVGDIGYENYSTASEYLKARKKRHPDGSLMETSVGFGNLAALVHVIEQQQQQP